jgi:predicted component of type VI protein secretion system
MPQKNQERVSIALAPAPSSGNKPDEIPPKVGVVGIGLGDTPTRYGERLPLAVSRADTGIGKLKPSLTGVEVDDHFSGQPGAKLLIEKLIFDKTTEQWPALIVEQVAPLRNLKVVLDCLYEAQRNPRLRRQLGQWLNDNPRALDELKRLTGTAKTKGI